MHGVNRGKPGRGQGTPGVEHPQARQPPRPFDRWLGRRGRSAAGARETVFRRTLAAAADLTAEILEDGRVVEVGLLELGLGLRVGLARGRQRGGEDGLFILKRDLRAGGGRGDGVLIRRLP